MAEYQARKAQYKVDAVKEMVAEFTQFDGYIFTDYRGISVEKITELRNQLRKEDAEYRVVKNRFAKIALNDLGHKGTEGHLTGPTAVALTNGEDASNAVSKILFDFSKKTSLQIKGAYLDGSLFDADAIAAYSKLPTRNDLISILMGTIKAPLTKLARTLQAVVDARQE